MSHPDIGPLSGYNSLTDKHLTGYFNNTRIRRQLQKAGLITRSGRILTEKEYRINAMRRDHQKYIRECLAQAIFHKVLDMERRHQIDIKRKLETFARKERVQRFKVDHSKRTEEDSFPAFSPCPPTGPKSGSNRRLGNHERSDSSESSSSLRPNTAPGNMQRPVRLQPLPKYSSSGNVPKMSTAPRQKHTADDEEQRFASTTDNEVRRITHTADYSVGISPYRLPIINNFVIPVPPPPQRHPKQTMGTASRRRKFRPTTAPNELDVSVKDTGKFHKTSLHSNVKITMVYLGKTVHLSYEDSDYRDEIKVFQQHCGGENLCVFKGGLLEEERFSLVSRRHRGFPFSLTFYINGIQVDRLSSCCEYKHRKGARLGGKNGYFQFINIEGASPCYRCIISMGLDKKPSPPPKSRTTEKDKKDREEEEEEEKGDEEEVIEGRFYNEVDDKEGKTSSVCDDDGEDDDQKTEDESDMDYNEEGVEEEEEGENKACKTDEYEADDDYEEDFDVEEYKPDEKHNEEGQVDDQVNEKSKSPSDDEKDDLNPERRRGTPSNAVPEASDRERDERDGHCDSDYLEDKQDRKRTESISSNSSVGSSSSEDGTDEDDIHERHEDHEAESDQEKRFKETTQDMDNHDLEKSLLPEEPDKELLEKQLEEHDMIVDENVEGHDDVVKPLSNRPDEDRNTNCVSPDNEQVNDDGTLGHMDEEDKSEAEDDLENKLTSDEEGGEYRKGTVV
ncbi:glutamate-rich protein 3 isoform X2 [Bufo bufo]|uniref:glutamate-rich protein 3 isoform X2 n=1 Tax=Bufo bufo TaxID=8384 RepID=UPI001ABE0945|nr:glutamate-rich protein 3 isoform X2 [Bufo bufo]